MPRAIWNNAVIAEAPEEAVEIVEGNVYFPPQAVRREYLQPTDKISICHWKGPASYYDVIVDGEVNHDAAWSYQSPKEGARQIEGHIAFWHGVRVEH